IDEGVDLSIRVTARLDPGKVTRRLGEARLLAVASPAYLAQRGCPGHPSEFAQHSCLGHSASTSPTGPARCLGAHFRVPWSMVQLRAADGPKEGAHGQTRSTL